MTGYYTYDDLDQGHASPKEPSHPESKPLDYHDHPLIDKSEHAATSAPVKAPEKVLEPDHEYSGGEYSV